MSILQYVYQLCVSPNLHIWDALERRQAPNAKFSWSSAMSPGVRKLRRPHARRRGLRRVRAHPLASTSPRIPFSTSGRVPLASIASASSRMATSRGAAAKPFLRPQLGSTSCRAQIQRRGASVEQAPRGFRAAAKEPGHMPSKVQEEDMMKLLSDCHGRGREAISNDDDMTDPDRPVKSRPLRCW